MDSDLASRYDLRIPRYTSYPTAPHFSPDISASDYQSWLGGIPGDAPVSLYVHIAYCRQICRFCACHAARAENRAVLDDYLDALAQEAAMLAKRLPERMTVQNIHFGGGSPSILSAEQIKTLFLSIRTHFDIAPDAEISVEMDPRSATKTFVAALARSGVTRASLGVQDFNPDVQKAIGRIQPFEQTERLVRWLKGVGIGAINLDLLYGLPLQSRDHVLRSLDLAASLTPSRIALFGYAHVPWMKENQKAIPEDALPGTEERWRLYEEAVRRLVEGHGFVQIGFDHFARPEDPLAHALSEHRLHRNFQGYTTDEAAVLLGLGASAIGFSPKGYVANETDPDLWRKTIRSGSFATRRGLLLSEEDLVRRALIETLMCNMVLDVGEVCRRFGRDPASFDANLSDLAPMEDDGLLTVKGRIIRMTRAGAPLVRAACACFDQYLKTGEQRHSKAV
ncbi:coproporphyrinogen-III oxidase [Alphaproteobacteria bacterium]|nr:coproporphyrinogen-III oxidase [Alphaproteobacteria bacterium]